ncbi:phenylalanine--tRNA ligase subunit beta [Buchnera aphidicola]|uniref:phenylalanine--tRNA ligase subunit beta n=1 Tax=Buchnera aphidicola TaxID=9 RepID=UPI002542FAEA|nr:phenylalanine--tRNA ligase subunit beta [Buchnera aphidicola]WII23771.1 phenylalanine--tRNA ligase subunit beta [Buchnera aphidicola (Sipha maydis)]
MKLSISWIKEYVCQNIKNSLICEQLTQMGFEADLIQIEKDFKKALIGEIIKIVFVKKKYFSLKIKVKKNIFLKILSKKKNCYPGMKVAVGIKKSINQIIQTKILKKNVYLEGKIYKYSDLKIFGNKNDIIEFPKNTTIGKAVKNYFKKNSDDLININIPANRHDLLGVLGIVRELSVYNNCLLKFDFFHLHNLKKQFSTKKIKISLCDKKICSNYFIKIIQGVDLSIKTPFWIREKLRKSHILSTDIVSDVINYVSLELGQSIHVFDMDKIKNFNITVRLSRKYEKIQLKKNFFLDVFPNTTVIANESDIISLGGYIHSEKFLISKKTKNLYLGAAVFHNSVVDIIKNKYNKYYFSYDNYYRRCEEKLSLLALEKISILIKNFCGGEIRYVNYSQLNVNVNKEIYLSYKKINKVLGIFINKFLIINILKKLEYCVMDKLSKLKVFPPYFRLDILCAEDIIADIIRFYGYNRIFSRPLETLSDIPIRNYIFDYISKIKNFLCMNHYSEVINYSFTDKKIQNLFFQDRKVIRIINPISKDLSCMRKSLFPGLLKNLKYNNNRQEKNIRFFESGLCFTKNSKKIFNVKQFLVVSGIISGYKYEKNWFHKDKQFSFYDLKEDIENFLYYFSDLKDIYFKNTHILGFDKNICSDIYYKNFKIGCSGMLSSDVKNFFNLTTDVFAFEIFIKKLPKFIQNNVKEFFSYPYSERDISIILDKDIPASEILSACYKTSLKYIFFVKIFDVYFGKNVPKNKKSLSIKIFFKNDKKNFTSLQIKNLFFLCIENLKKKFHAVLRDK